jgi:ADP-ribose pyrophosphatase YjhB (NUDIX family)
MGSAESEGVCPSCGTHPYRGPRLLVLVSVFAEGRMLLIRRGIEPSAGKWAPPGGYTEANETVETAAARELREETGIEVPPEAFLVIGVASVSHLNQVHVVLQALLDKVIEPSPQPPETTDARWFLQAELPREELWGTMSSADPEDLFWASRTQCFFFVQQSDNTRRVIFTQESAHPPLETLDTLGRKSPA